LKHLFNFFFRIETLLVTSHVYSWVGLIITISRSIYNLKIDTISTYHMLFDSWFLQLSNGIRHVMPSNDRRLKLKAKDINGSDRPAAGCVCEWIWLAGRLRDGCVCQWVNCQNKHIIHI
jgi:hypothetical protein